MAAGGEAKNGAETAMERRLRLFGFVWLNCIVVGASVSKARRECHKNMSLPLFITLPYLTSLLFFYQFYFFIFTFL